VEKESGVDEKSSLEEGKNIGNFNYELPLAAVRSKFQTFERSASLHPHMLRAHYFS
jgi:hypothetical protein